MGFLQGMFAGGHAVSNHDHFLGGGFGRLTHAGTVVSPHNALALTAVYSCIGIISDSQAQLPVAVIQTTRKNGKTQKTKILQHPIARIYNTQPNPFMTSMTLRCQIQAHALSWGNGYAEIQRDQAGTPIALWPLLPDRTWLRKRDGEVWYETTVGGQLFRIEAADMLHILGMSFDGLVGHSPLTIAREAVGLGLALEEFGAKFFGNDMKSGGFLTHPGKLSQQAQENILESMERNQGGLTNAHRLKILEEGLTFTPNTIPPEDAQFIKTREFQVEEIARLYRVPLFMIQSQAKDTSWGTGIGQQSLGFLRYTQNPWIIRWEQETDRKMLTPRERMNGLGIKHNVSALLRPDSEGRQKFYTAARKRETGWLLLNEVRELEDLNPIDQSEYDAQFPAKTTRVEASP